jgi:hypothetical protein
MWRKLKPKIYKKTYYFCDHGANSLLQNKNKLDNITMTKYETGNIFQQIFKKIFKSAVPSK